jgi:hypothetical protein
MSFVAGAANRSLNPVTRLEYPGGYDNHVSNEVTSRLPRMPVSRERAIAEERGGGAINRDLTLGAPRALRLRPGKREES